jgi:hypothetical protein
VLTRTAALVFGADQRVVATAAQAKRPAPDFAALSPDGRSLSILAGGVVTVQRLTSHAGRPQRVFSGDGVSQLAWSPDGRWLLLSWPAADQWIFVRPGGHPRIAADSRISEQLAAPAGPHLFPQLNGWCCNVSGGG